MGAKLIEAAIEVAARAVFETCNCVDIEGVRHTWDSTDRFAQLYQADSRLKARVAIDAYTRALAAMSHSLPSQGHHELRHDQSLPLFRRPGSH